MLFARHGYDNPVNTVDPSGHKACETEDCRNITRRELLIRELSEVFNWSVNKSFSTAAIGLIYSTANDIRGYIDKLTGGNGIKWMNTFIGSATFSLDNTNTNLLNAQGFVFPNNLIHLADGFSSQDVAHEIGHILDNNVSQFTSINTNSLLIFYELTRDATFIGGGPADAMVSALGGKPNYCIPRFISIFGKGIYEKYIAGPYSWQGNVYGNNSVADDFADTFEYAIYYPTQAPQIRLLWLNSFISVSGSK